jgi:hypothetical protein
MLCQFQTSCFEHPNNISLRVQNFEATCSSSNHLLLPLSWLQILPPAVCSQTSQTFILPVG